MGWLFESEEDEEKARRGTARHEAAHKVTIEALGGRVSGFTLGDWGGRVDGYMPDYDTAAISLLAGEHAHTHGWGSCNEDHSNARRMLEQSESGMTYAEADRQARDLVRRNQRRIDAEADSMFWSTWG